MCDIITISACQGQGKSTFMRDIFSNSKFSNDIELYANKTARSVLDELGMPLDEIYKNSEALKSFQDKILDRHFEIVAAKNKSEKRILLVERSFIDIAVFSIMNLGRLNEYSDWLDSFVGTCIKAQQSVVQHSLYIPMRIVSIKNDATRPYNMNYNFAYDSILANYMEFAGVSVGCITQKDRIERVKQFDDLIGEIYE